MLRIAEVTFVKDTVLNAPVTMEMLYSDMDTICDEIKSKLKLFDGTYNVRPEFTMYDSTVVLNKIVITSVNATNDFENVVRNCVNGSTRLAIMLILKGASLNFKFYKQSDLSKISILPNTPFSLSINTVNIVKDTSEIKQELSKVKSIRDIARIDGVDVLNNMIVLRLTALKNIEAFQSITYEAYDQLPAQEAGFYTELFTTLQLRKYANSDRFFDSIVFNLVQVLGAGSTFRGIFTASGKNASEKINNMQNKIKDKIQSEYPAVEVTEINVLNQNEQNGIQHVDFEIKFRVKPGYMVSLSDNSSILSVGFPVGAIVLGGIILATVIAGVVGLNIVFKNWDKVEPVLPTIIPETTNIFFGIVIILIMFFFIFIITKFIGGGISA